MKFSMEHINMTDERVEAAIKNWAPRFTSQGVDYNDFFRTTARVQKWEDWCHEWVATGDVHYDLAVKAEAKGNLLSAGEAYIGAALCYHFGKFVFQDFYDEYMSCDPRCTGRCRECRCRSGPRPRREPRCRCGPR